MVWSSRLISKSVHQFASATPIALPTWLVLSRTKKHLSTPFAHPERSPCPRTQCRKCPRHGVPLGRRPEMNANGIFPRKGCAPFASLWVCDARPHRAQVLAAIDCCRWAILRRRPTVPCICIDMRMGMRTCDKTLICVCQPVCRHTIILRVRTTNEHCPGVKTRV